MDDINTNPDTEETITESSTDLITEMVTGIPAPVKKNAIKAFGQLCTAAVDVPVAILEGKAKEIRAGTDARVELIKSGSEQIAEQMNIPTEYVDAATSKFAKRIIQEQINIDTIAQNAQKELQQEPLDESVSTSSEEINTDWLNSFEKEAMNKNSEEMQLLFGKILAGEIRNPSTYSIRTVKILAQLNKEVAELFQRFCSICSTVYLENKIFSSNLISFGKPASNSSTLKEYGMNPKNLNLLVEYSLVDPNFMQGLLIDEYINGPESNGIPIPIKYNNDFYVLALQEGKYLPNNRRLIGPSLTKSGEELLGIVDIKPNDAYTNALIDYLNNSNVEIIKV